MSGRVAVRTFGGDSRGVPYVVRVLASVSYGMALGGVSTAVMCHRCGVPGSTLSVSWYVALLTGGLVGCFILACTGAATTASSLRGGSNHGAWGVLA